MAEVDEEPQRRSEETRAHPHDMHEYDYVNDDLKAGFLPEGVAEQLKNPPPSIFQFTFV